MAGAPATRSLFLGCRTYLLLTNTELMSEISLCSSRFRLFEFAFACALSVVWKTPALVGCGILHHCTCSVSKVISPPLITVSSARRGAKVQKFYVSISMLTSSRKIAVLENITCVLKLESRMSSCLESTPLEISRGLRSPSLTQKSGVCLGGSVLTMPYKMLKAPK